MCTCLNEQIRFAWPFFFGFLLLFLLQTQGSLSEKSGMTHITSFSAQALRQQPPEKGRLHADTADQYEQTVLCLKDLRLWPWESLCMGSRILALCVTINISLPELQQSEEQETRGQGYHRRVCAPGNSMKQWRTILIKNREIENPLRELQDWVEQVDEERNANKET